MFEKIGRLADAMAATAGQSRRGFLGRCIHLAGGVATVMIPFILSDATAGGPRRKQQQICSAPWNCACKGNGPRNNYGCGDQCKGCLNEATCDNECYVFCYQYCSPF